MCNLDLTGSSYSSTLDDWTLAAWLYALQLLCIAGSFLLTCAALKPLMTTSTTSTAPRLGDWPLIVVWLAILWLNFSPLYTILAHLPRLVSAAAGSSYWLDWSSS